MQNPPLLNANTATKAHVSGPPRLSSASADQTAETGTFQQNLAHHLEKSDETRQPSRLANDNKGGGTQNNMEKTGKDPAIDLAHRKLKLHQLRASLREVQNHAEEQSHGAAMPEIIFAMQTTDDTMSPDSADVLAQIRQSIADDTGQETTLELAVPAAQPTPATPPAADEFPPSVDAITNTQPTTAVEQKPSSAADVTPTLESDTDPQVFTAERMKSNEPELALPEQQGRVATDALGMHPVRPVAIHANAGVSLAGTPIMTPPGTERWNQAIGQRILWMVGATQQSATLTLNPPEMGTLQIVINVQNDKADASFFSDRPEVRQALQDGMDNLREMMLEAGISLGQTSIGQRDRAEQEARQSHTAQRNGTGTDRNANEEDAMHAASRIRVGRGLVDTFA